MKVITATQAASLIEDGWWVVPGGFGCCGHPDSLSKALRKRFLETGRPRGLNLLFASGAGDKQARGLNAWALDGMLNRVIGGFWGFCPALVQMAREQRIEAHNWPQGVISKLFSSIASGSPGLLSKVGLGTFVDPRLEGGVIEGCHRPLVESVRFREEDYLFYPAPKVDCALLRGTVADAQGNISLSGETSYMDALSQALAARNSGGLVIVQVQSIDDKQLPPADVRIPGMLVDYVVLTEDSHPQTYGTPYDAAYTSNQAKQSAVEAVPPSLAKHLIVARAAEEMRKHDGAHINLGIGIPALLGAEARAQGWSDYTLSIESGLIGGIPDEGLAFGAVRNPDAILEQSALFDFYDGGGIDVAFLGFGEVDAMGNVNVSRFGGRLPGAGGFINISQTAKKVVFCGTLTTSGLTLEIRHGALHVRQEGRVRKFCPQVAQLTFSAEQAVERGQQVLYITERAVFSLEREGLMLRELAPGITPQQLRAAMDCPFHISNSLLDMNAVPMMAAAN
ncbi:acyl CoA:acetate/3-ketoacid CoA transferase [Chromobacterium amazonense]|uniref:Acetate CoA-transferase YdiF n=1 Tax=Chromobacterium amazonense TaxID=1382803 RepID=A0ABU8UYZ3_9NEIS|nr:CoA-transferase [Chromobacterium amazonense]MDQ4539855.1 CoA-transferase [Chromobacterium amazonense]